MKLMLLLEKDMRIIKNKTKNIFRREVIINSIKNKNKTLSNDWKLNILKKLLAQKNYINVKVQLFN